MIWTAIVIAIVSVVGIVIRLVDRQEAKRREKQAVEAAEEAMRRAKKRMIVEGGWTPYNYLRETREDVRNEHHIYWGAMDKTLDPPMQSRTTESAKTTAPNT